MYVCVYGYSLSLATGKDNVIARTVAFQSHFERATSGTCEKEEIKNMSQHTEIIERAYIHTYIHTHTHMYIIHAHIDAYF